jgi:hypothetical protein
MSSNNPSESPIICIMQLCGPPHTVQYTRAGQGRHQPQLPPSASVDTPSVSPPPKCLLNKNVPQRIPPVDKRQDLKEYVLCVQSVVISVTQSVSWCSVCEVTPCVHSCFKTFHIKQDLWGGELNQKSCISGVHKSWSSGRLSVVRWRQIFAA